MACERIWILKVTLTPTGFELKQNLQQRHHLAYMSSKTGHHTTNLAEEEIEDERTLEMDRKLG